MALPAYVDPLDPTVAWLNGQTALVGRGKPLAGGVDTRRRRSPGEGAYAVVTWIATSRDGSEAPISTPLLSFAVYGATEPNARRAAVAVARLLDGFDGDPLPFQGGALLCVESITGPSYLPDGDEHRYLVDAAISFEPA